MKRIAITLTFALSLLLALTACMHGVHGSGVRKTEKRDLAAFNAIETTGARLSRTSMSGRGCSPVGPGGKRVVFSTGAKKS